MIVFCENHFKHTVYCS